MYIYFNFIEFILINIHLSQIQQNKFVNATLI